MVKQSELTNCERRQMTAQFDVQPKWTQSHHKLQEHDERGVVTKINKLTQQYATHATTSTLVCKKNKGQAASIHDEPKSSQKASVFIQRPSVCKQPGRR